MKSAIIIIGLMISLGFIASLVGAGGGSFLVNFLVAFGLISIIAVVAVLIMAKKKNK